MAECVKKRIPRVKICAGDLRNKISIQTRALGGNRPGQNNPGPTFTTIFQPWAGVETPNGRSKFLGVNINEDTTHIFIVRFDSTISGLEVANNFVLFGTRRMRILSVKNMNEDNYFLAIECTERGLSTKDATEA